MGALLDILAEFGGGRGDPANVAVRFLLPSIFWCVLAYTALGQWRHSRETKDVYVGVAALIGLSRELLMFIAEYGGYLGLVSRSSLQSVYPPLEHAATELSMILVAYAFLRYFTRQPRFTRAYVMAGVGAVLVLYLLTAPSWTSFLLENPDARFGQHWGDMLFRITGSLWMATVLGALLLAGKNGTPVPRVLQVAFLFFFLDDALMVSNLATGDINRDVYGPIRHNLHIWAIPLFLASYWIEVRSHLRKANEQLVLSNLRAQEQAERLREAHDELEVRVAERTAELSQANEAVRASEEEYRTLAEAAQQERESMEEMLHLISHDLRNPLSGIHGRAQLLQGLLKELEPSSTARRSADAIVASARRMNAMIQELVESTRLESGRLEMHKEPIDLLDAVCELVERVGTPEDRARIQVESAGPSPTLLADPDCIERVIVNLTTNALKYSPAESAVIIRIEQSEDEVVISVTDQGAGIPPEHLPHIFERFYRVTGGKGVAEAEGLGLGLYIARLIVEAHGGRIWADSEVSKGSSFHFALPLAQTS